VKRDPSHEVYRLLRQVSRSFYLTLRVLPGAIAPQISLAYLLARTADTIADTGLLPLERRTSALRELCEAINCAAERRAMPSLEFGDLAAARKAPAGQGSAAERTLLERAGIAVSLLQNFSEDDRRRMREVLETIIGGQELDLMRFGPASVKSIRALETEEELDDYTYRVAGCVGEFWTRMCRAHLFPGEAIDDERLLENGIRFGKGLQLVNVLRDVPRDLREGRCYIPRSRLAPAGIEAEELLRSDSMARFRPVYDEYLSLAGQHLAAGWDYIDSLPRGQARVRLSCSWPVLIGLRTISRLRAGNVLDSAIRIKIGRSEVRHLILRSILRYPFRSLWTGLYRQALR
jgi:farnesyl-diphosphate farnesyltransferase